MNMTMFLHQLIDVGNCVGVVEAVHMYDKELLTVDGKTNDGKKFTITINIMEEKEND